jgi:peptidoglycan/LPS O-acetylase OafA/YrhL
MKPMRLGPGPEAAYAPAAEASPRGRRVAADRIGGFDGVRALAFLGVFANHKLGIVQRDALGEVGVWTFYVLSGFLITGILARSREEVETGRISPGSALRRFYLRRSVRIFPIYYLLLVAALIVSCFTYVDNFWLRERLAYFLYATNFLIGMRDAWLGDFSHLWSLAVEEQYYLLFAPMVLFTPRRWLGPLCLTVLGCGLAVNLAMHLSYATPISIYVNSLVNFGMLGFGGLVGLFAIHRSAPAWLTGGPMQAAVAACIVAAPLAFGADRAAWMDFGPAVALLAGLLLFQIFSSQGTWFVAVLDAAPLRMIGRVSYAGYLFHPFIHFWIAQRVLGRAGLHIEAPRPLQIVLEFAATMLLCAFSWRVIETPINRWGARASNRLFVAAPQRRAVRSDAARLA